MTTKAEKAHMDRVQALGCMACHQLGHYAVAELHHPKSGNRRISVSTVIPLCPAHHRGVDHDPEIHGPSLALAPRSFHTAFGSDVYLLARTEMMLRGSWDEGLIY